MDRHPASRRRQRSVRITVAVVVLSAASALVAAAVAADGARLLSVSAVVALLCGWAGLRIMWSVVVQARYEHGSDRAELAQTYRRLFAERAVEHQAFTRSMTARMRERDQVIGELENTVVDTQRRAVVAETTVKRVQRRLAEADGRIITLEEYLARSQADHRAAVERLEAAEEAGAARGSAPAASSLSGVEPVEPPARPTVVPAWADLETDPTAALMAWEERAQQHALGARHVADDRTSRAVLSRGPDRLAIPVQFSEIVVRHFPISSGASRGVYAHGSARSRLGSPRSGWSAGRENLDTLGISPERPSPSEPNPSPAPALLRRPRPFGNRRPQHPVYPVRREDPEELRAVGHADQLLVLAHRQREHLLERGGGVDGAGERRRRRCRPSARGTPGRSG